MVLTEKQKQIIELKKQAALEKQRQRNNVSKSPPFTKLESTMSLIQTTSLVSNAKEPSTSQMMFKNKDNGNPTSTFNQKATSNIQSTSNTHIQFQEPLFQQQPRPLSYSPKFKKKYVEITQHQHNSFSPKFKNQQKTASVTDHTNSCKRNLFDNQPQGMQKLQFTESSVSRAEINRQKALEKLQSKLKPVPTTLPISPTRSRQAQPQHSYSSKFKVNASGGNICTGPTSNASSPNTTASEQNTNCHNYSPKFKNETTDYSVQSTGTSPTNNTQTLSERRHSFSPKFKNQQKNTYVPDDTCKRNLFDNQPQETQKLQSTVSSVSRAEINRQKALEKLELKLKSSSTLPIKSNVHKIPDSEQSGNTNVNRAGNLCEHLDNQSSHERAENRAEMNKQKAMEKLRAKQQISEQSKNMQQNEIIEVSLVAKSGIWFKLECSERFSSTIGNIFKDVKNKNFDATWKQWSFHVKDYKSIVELSEKHTQIKIIETIPKTIVNILQSAHMKENNSKSANLDRISKNILDKLLPFQKQSIEFAVQKEGRVLIADDMGLGKTIQAIAICDYYMDDWPILVICPSSVKMSWQQHFLTWIPSLHKDDINIIHTGRDQLYDSSVTIVSCDMASKLSSDFAGRNYQVIVVDESHMLKNKQAARTKNIIPLLHASKRVILLSGTPALSRPKELFTQISALRRNLFKSYFNFAKRYCAAHEGPFGLDDNGCSYSDELNAVLKATIMIRRMKYEVLDQLPSKIRQHVVLDPSLVQITKELQSYEKCFLSSKKDKRMALLQYYEITGKAKVKGVIQFILEKLENTNEKMIVFCHHHFVLDSIETAICKKKIGYIQISGSTTAKSRQSYVDAFNNEKSCRVAILSLTAAGTGLNMTASSLVIFAELYWNPGQLIQAEDRVYRIGQKRSVSIVYLIANNTADDYIWSMVKSKLKVLTNLGVGTKKGLDGVTFSQQKREERQSSIKDFFSDLQNDEFFEDESLISACQEPQPKRVKTS